MPKTREEWNAYQKQYKKDHPLTEEQKTERNAYLKQWRSDNQHKTAGYAAKRPKYVVVPSEAPRRRSAHLIQRYGIDSDQWNEIFEFQDNACGCCGTQDPTGSIRFWQMDHCHETDQLRGIVCTRCNRMIGQLGDHASAVASLMTRALAYLARSGDMLSPGELQQIIDALQTNREVLLESAVDTAHPDRRARTRHNAGCECSACAVGSEA